MARLPKPGENFGPCRGGHCRHSTCHDVRALAAQVCILCGKKIGFGKMFEKDVKTGLPVHSDCARKAREKICPHCGGVLE